MYYTDKFIVDDTQVVGKEDYWTSNTKFKMPRYAVDSEGTLYYLQSPILKKGVQKFSCVLSGKWTSAF